MAAMKTHNYIAEYWAAINNGAVTVGKYIRQAYAMIIHGLEDGQIHFDSRKANKAIRFIENFCHHSEGRSDLLKLELWQKALVSAIFGIVDDSGIRVYREVFIVVARKNGKSLLISAIFAYMAYIDGEYGAKLYCIAPKLEQAEKVFDGFYQMVLSDEELHAVTKKRRADLYIAEANTIIKPLAFNAKKSDGFNPQGVCCDEVASWPSAGGLKQYEVMKSAFGARKEPLILSISTAGYINDGIYDELMKRSTALLNGGSREKRLLPLLYIIDDPAQWDSLEELRKSNPNLGVSVTEKFYREAIATAEVSPSAKAEYLCKYCNIKQNSSVAWLDFDSVDKAQSEIEIDSFAGCYALGGIDLSQTTDLTAASVVIERGGVLYDCTHFWMPAATLDEHIERESIPYDIYVQQGVLSLSGSAYVDYHDVLQWFIELREKYGIYVIKVGYDRYSAQYLVDELKSAGFQPDDVNQGTNLSPIMIDFEGMIKSGQILFCGNNNLLKQHLLNVAVKQELETRRIKPVKIDSRAHIDGFVSVIDALTIRSKYYNELSAMLANEGGD